MKKSSKKSLIGAGICIALGISLIIAGALKGGFSQLKEYDIGDIYHIDMEAKDAKKALKDADYSKEIDASDVEKLSINVGAAEVVMATGDKDVITFSTNNMTKSEANLKNGTLELKAEKKSGKKPGMVYITVPKNFGFNKIDITVGAGEMTIEEIKAEKITIDIGAGSILADKAIAEKADIKLGAGELRIDDGSFEKMNADIAMGSMTVNGVISEDCELKVGMGAVDMELDGKYEDYSYEIKAGMGTVSIDDREYAGAVSVNDDNDAESEFDIDCGMGTVNIQFN